MTWAGVTPDFHISKIFFGSMCCRPEPISARRSSPHPQLLIHRCHRACRPHKPYKPYLNGPARGPAASTLYTVAARRGQKSVESDKRKVVLLPFGLLPLTLGQRGLYCIGDETQSAFDQPAGL
jgi:hypothetical protein